MSLLDKIQNPVDIKSLSTEELAQLASEIRQELIERGHDPRTVRRAVRYRRWQELV